MRLIPLTSSSIAAIGWSPDLAEWNSNSSPLGDLVVQFQNRKGDWSAYRYFDVPMAVFVRIVTGESQGKAFIALVKDAGYSWVKVTPDEVRAIP